LRVFYVEKELGGRIFYYKTIELSKFVRKWNKKKNQLDTAYSILCYVSVAFRSRRFAFRGVPVSLLGAEAPVGSLLPRTPAVVFAPSTPINRVRLIIIPHTKNIRNAYK